LFISRYSSAFDLLKNKGAKNKRPPKIKRSPKIKRQPNKNPVRIMLYIYFTKKVFEVVVCNIQNIDFRIQ